GRGSILITSQLPVATWHEVIAEPTLGDAILDRIVHNAYRLELDGPSMRKLKASDAAYPATAPVATIAADNKPPKGAKTHRSRSIGTRGRDRSEHVIAMRRNGWSRSSECA